MTGKKRGREEEATSDVMAAAVALCCMRYSPPNHNAVVLPDKDMSGKNNCAVACIALHVKPDDMRYNQCMVLSSANARARSSDSGVWSYKSKSSTPSPPPHYRTSPLTESTPKASSLPVRSVLEEVRDANGWLTPSYEEGVRKRRVSCAFITSTLILPVVALLHNFSFSFREKIPINNAKAVDCNSWSPCLRVHVSLLSCVVQCQRPPRICFGDRK